MQTLDARLTQLEAQQQRTQPADQHIVMTWGDPDDYDEDARPQAVGGYTPPAIDAAAMPIVIRVVFP